MDKKRVEWIDFAKGLTILLVIVGHTVWGETRGLIFSFHMPLFFIMSSITFKYSENAEQLLNKAERSFRHLIIPAFLVVTIWQVISVIEYSEVFNSSESLSRFIYDRILMMVYSCGVDINIGLTKIYGIGIPWFFVVLFLGRMLYDYINLRFKNKVVIISCILCILGIVIGIQQCLPLSFDLVLAIQPFFLIGQNYQRLNLEKHIWIKLVISFIIWFSSFELVYYIKGDYNYLELAVRRYSLFPLCYITAFFGTIFVSLLSIQCCKLKKITIPLLYIGKNSLYLLLVHCFDNLSFIQKAWSISSNDYINSVVRVIVDCGIFIVIMGMRKVLKGICKNKSYNEEVKL